MRGEETQLAGAFDDDIAATLAVLPGTHSKWAQVERGRVVAFQTHMTGELYAVLLANSILGRLASQGREETAPGAAVHARRRAWTGRSRTCALRSSARARLR